MAVDSQHLCGHAKCACSGDSLRKHSEEEVGSEFCLHGILCLRSCPPVLGRLGLQDVLRREASSHLGKGRDTLSYKYLLSQADLPSSEHLYHNGTVEVAQLTPFFPMATLVYFQFVFAAITLVLLAGSVLGRMSFRAWMVFVPLWLTCSYTVGAFSIWGGGFLWQWGVIDYAGGYVIHLSSGVAGFTAAYWVLKPYSSSTVSCQHFIPSFLRVMKTIDFSSNCVMFF